MTSKATGHKVTTKAHHAHHAKAVGLAVGDWLPVCAFEAVAQSLRLAGQPVHDDDVCELWHLLGERPDGVPVGEALAAVARFGLDSQRPHFAQQPPSGLAFEFPCGVFVGDQVANDSHGLILRIDVPGPHAVLATDRGWWSWGELYDPWPCRVEEAWAVSWT